MWLVVAFVICCLLSIGAGAFIRGYMQVMKERGKVIIDWSDPDTRRISREYVRPRGGELVVHPTKKEPGRVYLLLEECRYDADGIPSWRVNPRTGVNYRIIPRSSTLSDTPEGMYRAWNEAHNPETLYKHRKENGLAKAFRSNWIKDKYPWLGKALVIGAILIGIMFIMGVVTFFMVQSGSG